MCASCWNERRDTKAVEGANSEDESCCWCGSNTTSGIWVREDPEKLSCHHCEFEQCDELATVMIQQVWVCTHHIEWAMELAFKPVKDAMKI
jgi:hypothetical protein